MSYAQTERRMNVLPLLQGGTTAGNGFGATRQFVALLDVTFQVKDPALQAAGPGF
jgi:hypothetical protein